MSNEVIVMCEANGFESSFTRMDVASIAARQRVHSTGEPVTLRVYEIDGTSRALKRRLRVLRRLDGSIAVAAA